MSVEKTHTQPSVTSFRTETPVWPAVQPGRQQCTQKIGNPFLFKSALLFPPEPKGTNPNAKSFQPCYFIRSIFTFSQLTLKRTFYKSFLYKVWKLHKNNFCSSWRGKYKLVLFTLLKIDCKCETVPSVPSRENISTEHREYCMGLLNVGHCTLAQLWDWETQPDPIQEGQGRC